jgi:hypothetical protein
MIVCVWLTHPECWFDRFYVTIGKDVEDCRQQALASAKEHGRDRDVEELTDQTPGIHTAPNCMVFEQED